jgi:hypothetical protein
VDHIGVLSWIGIVQPAMHRSDRGEPTYNRRHLHVAARTFSKHVPIGQRRRVRQAPLDIGLERRRRRQLHSLANAQEEEDSKVRSVRFSTLLLTRARPDTAAWGRSAPLKAGVLLLKPGGEVFAFVYNNTGGRGFVSAARGLDGRIAYMYSTTRHAAEYLGLGSCLCEQQELAESVIN